MGMFDYVTVKRSVTPLVKEGNYQTKSFYQFMDKYVLIIDCTEDDSLILVPALEGCYFTGSFIIEKDIEIDLLNTETLVKTRIKMGEFNNIKSIEEVPLNPIKK